MKKPKIPANEQARIESLKSYALLDTLPEEDFDDITWLASQICGTPVSTITLVDANRQWFKSKKGLASNESERDFSFCAHAINYPKAFIIPDSREDNRFADNPLVTGEPHVIFYAGIPLINNDGHALGTLCVIDNKPHNLTEEQIKALEVLSKQVMNLIESRKKNLLLNEKQNELQKIIDLFEQTSAVAKIGGWDFDVINNKIFWTSVTKKIHEAHEDFEPTLDKSLSRYKEGKSRDKIINIINEASKKPMTYDLELEIITEKGNERWVKAKGQSVFEKGKCVRMYGTLQNIHEEKLKDIQLNKSEELFRQTLLYAPIGIALVAPDGKWIKVNTKLCDIVGYTEEELLEIDFQTITHPDDLDIDLSYVDQLLSGKIESYELEKRYIHKQGHIIWILLSVSLIKDEINQPLYFISHIMNITKRKNYEQTIIEDRHLLLTLIDNIPVNIFIKDLNSKKILVNKKEVEYSGYKNEKDILGKDDYELYSKESADISFEEDQYVFNTGTAILNRETFSIKQDGITNWFLTSKIPLLNNEQQITGLLGISYDINERKKTEKNLKSLVDVTTEQNTRLLNFAHIVSHNLRTHSGNFAMLLESIAEETDESEKQMLFSLLQKAADNLLETVKNLNEIVEINTRVNQETNAINLYDAIEKTRNNVRALLFNNHVELINEVDTDIKLYMVPAYIDSILLNFITNAIKYRSENVKSYIKFTSEKDNGNVIIIISDNGIGIDMARNGDKLFGMYNTFHNNKDAKGIGLFITKNQIEAMGGKIDVSSSIGVGTTFKITFNQ